jgi:hypothetical protein
LTEEKLFSAYRKWKSYSDILPKGVMVASDIQQEWLLPWWWENYSRFNTLPVVFVDFGMSKEKKKWCKEHGTLIPLLVPDIFVAERDKMDPALVSQLENELFGTFFWAYRNAWFKKPLACLQSPFEISLWIDLDCEVCGPLDVLYDLYGDSIAMTRYPEKCITYPIYNSGVVVFRRGLPIYEEWADLSIEQNHLFGGDEEILSKLLLDQDILIHLPPIYNWSRMWPENPNAVIRHWHGPYGKHYIHHQMMTSNFRSLDF